MKYTKEEVMQYVYEEDVKFIRLSFCDVYGKTKNIAIMPSELKRAFEYGIAFDASAVAGFGDEAHSDLFLHPIPDTLALLPWRPEHGKVVRMISYITYPDGTPFECDTRALLAKAVEEANKKGFEFYFGSEQEFYLFKLDEDGNQTKEPYDNAGYMDIAPDDKGENIRREVCLTVEQMGIRPESSHHEEGPGQNEIDFCYSAALEAADNTVTFQNVVKTVAKRNGLYADFSAKPLEKNPGNGFHINMSVKSKDGSDNMDAMIAGVLDKVCEITAFLNPTKNSYKRFGTNKAPKYVSWSRENRSQLIRIPAAVGEFKRAELRSPDPTANPYLAFTLLIYASIEGIENKMSLPDALNINLFTTDKEELKGITKLPEDLSEACSLALQSDFIKKYIPEEILDIYCNR